MFTLQVRKLFRKTLVFGSTTPERPTRSPTRLALEALEDRALPSVSSLPVASPEAESPLAVATLSLFALVEQRVQQVTTFVQYASNVVNTLDWALLQEVAAFEQQVAGFLGINLDSANPSQGASATQPGRSTTTSHNSPNPSSNDALPVSDSAADG